jgi:glycosyltransferase involved in cell wall biosynthesis
MPAGAGPGQLAAQRRALAARGWQLYFDVSPLVDPTWTGIPVVAAGLAQALTDIDGDDTQFFYKRHLVKRGAVLDALRRRSGLYLERDIQQGHASDGPIPIGCATGRTIGLFPSIKLVPSLFRVEASLYHDISTFLLPQYHTAGNIQHHLAALRRDIQTNLVNFAVSRATADDMIAYLGAPPDATFVAHNGVSWPWWFPVEAANEPPPYDDPYLVVLGTREPRKNLAVVWHMLRIFPEVAARARIVVIGRQGWLADEPGQAAPPPDLLASGRIVFTGYVSEFDKYRLLRAATASIYPSLFEGFGLPIVESLSLGTPCIASWSSALPEVGGDACCYFDPLSAEDLASQIVRVLEEDQSNPRPSQSKPALAKLRWPKTLRQILWRMAEALPILCTGELV